MKDRFVSSSNDTCNICNRIGGLEFADAAGSRVMEDSSSAESKSCIICGTKWERSDDATWDVIRTPDEELLEVVGNV